MCARKFPLAANLDLLTLVREHIRVSKRIHTQDLLNENTSGPSHQKELTVIKDTETEVTTPYSHPDIFAGTNPFPMQVPIHVLKRKYFVHKLTWSIGEQINASIDFPASLLAIPVIQDYLRPFLWMRAGIQLEVRINTSPFHYGALLVSWLPNCNNNLHAANYIQQSGNHPHVLSVASQQALTMHIPYINPINYFYANDATSEICRVFFNGFCPLTRVSEDVTDTIYVQVYASFEDIDLAGYLPVAAETQADISENQYWDAILAESEKLQAEEQEMIDSSPEAKEADSENKGTSKVIVKKSVAKDTVLPFFGALSNVFDGIVSFGSGIAKMFTIFDKPAQNVQPSLFYQAQGYDMAHCNGFDPSVKLSLDSHATSSLNSRAMGNKRERIDLMDIASTPMLQGIVVFRVITDEYYVPVWPIPSTAPTQLDYLGFVSNLFKYWRGPIRYMLQFFTSPFITCRFRVSILYSDVMPIDENTGDVITQVVDVKGDTVYKFSVPYLFETVYRQLDDSVSLPHLLVKPIIDPVGPSFAADPTIYMAVWRAAGSGFQWMYPSTPRYKTGPPPETQNDICREFATNFEQIIKGSKDIIELGMVAPETVRTVNDLTKRYVLGSINASPNFGLWNNALVAFGNIFKYWHGGRRFLCHQRVPNASNLAGFGNVTWGSSADSANGIVLQDARQNSIVRFEIPWYNRVPFRTVGVQSTSESKEGPLNGVLPYIGLTTDYDYFWAGAEDFSYGFLCAPLQLPAPSPLVLPVSTTSNSEDDGFEELVETL